MGKHPGRIFDDAIIRGDNREAGRETDRWRSFPMYFAALPGQSRIQPARTVRMRIGWNFGGWPGMDTPGICRISSTGLVVVPVN